MAKEINWDRVFDLRCKSKRGQYLTDDEMRYLTAAHAQDKPRYVALNADIFDATHPNGRSDKQQHNYVLHKTEPWLVCTRCGMVRNRERETPCKGVLPKIEQRD